MGFGDISTSLISVQMAGKTVPLRVEVGCFSFDASSGDVPTQLTHVVGGLAFGCLTAGGCIGRPMIGSVCSGGYVGFTVCGDPEQSCPYIVAGW